MNGPSEEKIFQELLSLDDGHDKYIDSICGDDQDLAERIRKLWKARQQPDSLLETIDQPSDSSNQDPADLRDQCGEVIGNYKLLQVIGEGGFGLVYLAEQQQPVRRQVALKVIKPGMDSKAVVARFEAERQALAMMDHPGIATVLDGGSFEIGAGVRSSHRPYFVMELVKGIPITEYCDRNQLNNRERMNLFKDVCDAVQHAHQKGIIHRDIKPSNVMVTLHDGKPVVKVIDFGVAKATHQRLTEKTMFTEYGQMIGTPQYMSPEQAEMSGLDIDTRSDIYSLGVLLYELLTGSTPLEAKRIREAGFAEMQRLIREEEPQKPSTRISTAGEQLTALAKHRSVSPERLNRDLRGDLDWIVMCALEKDRRHRYQTASDFARDVERCLQHQPVAAVRRSHFYTIRKFIQRNRKAVIFGTAAGVVFLVIAVLSIESIIEIQNRHQRELNQNSAKMNEAIAKTEVLLDRAVESPPGDDRAWLVAKASCDRIRDLLEKPLYKPTESKALAALKEYETEEFNRQLAEQIETVVIAGATRLDLESWVQMERDFQKLFLKQGIDFEKQTPAEIANIIKAHPASGQLVDGLELWIGTKGHIGHLGGAVANRESMQPFADAILAADEDSFRSGIRKMYYVPGPKSLADIEAFRKGVNLDDYSVRTLSWLASVYHMVGEKEQAEAVMREALMREPDNVMTNYDYALSLQSQGSWDLAIRYYLRCVALRPNVSGVWQCLGVAHFNLKEYADARQALEEAVKLNANHAPTRTDLAEVLLETKDLKSAEEHAAEATRINPDYGLAYLILGRAQMLQGNLERAQKNLEKAIQFNGLSPLRKSECEAWIQECKSKRESEKRV